MSKKDNTEAKDKDSQDFKQYLQDKKDYRRKMGEARKVSHPFRYIEYDSHKYANYALKHRDELDNGPQMSPKQGWQMMGSLINDWSPIQIAIAVIIIVFIIFTMVMSFIG